MPTSQRIAWLDAFKGIAILLVVFTHVETLGLKSGCFTNGIASIALMVAMPSFMFISGFLAHKPYRRYDAPQARKTLRRKVRTLVFPAVIFGLLYSVFCFSPRLGFSVVDSIKLFIFDGVKFGYWYTWSLFWMVAVTSIVLYLMRNCRPRLRWATLGVVALVSYLLYLPGSSFYDRHSIAGLFSLYNFFQYYQFFLFGILCSNYRQQFFSWLGKGWFVVLMLIGFVSCLALRITLMEAEAHGMLFKMGIKLLILLGRYCAVLALVGVLRKCESRLARNTLLDKALLYTGRHSLDIYMIHFFLLSLLPGLRSSFSAVPNSVLQLLMLIATDLAITAICLIISRLIRLIPKLGYLMLGQSPQK